MPFAAALAATALSSALNPSGAFGAELGGAMSSWLLPLLVAVAAPAATATLRGGGADLNGRGSTTVSEANVALFAAAATLFSAGVPARGAAAAAAFAGGGAFAAAASVVAPAMAVALADYFVVRRRALDTAALVDGKDAKGDFWFRGGFNPRAALAFAAGAAFPLADFAATAEIGARMVNVVGPGVQTILAPGIALARGAGLGGAVAAAAYLALNRLAPPRGSPRAAARRAGAAARRASSPPTAWRPAPPWTTRASASGDLSRRTPRPWAARERGEPPRGANAMASGGPGH